MTENRKQRTENRREKGVVLILTFIVMTTLTAIVVAFLSMTSIQTKGAGYDIASHKALWLAEAGIQKYVYLLKYEQSYRESYPNLNESLGNGSYSVTASYDEPNSAYTLTSTGTVSVINRQITQSFEITSALLERGIHADGSLLNFGSSSGVINGNVSCHVSVANSEGMTINGTITEGLAKITPALNFDYYKTLAQAQSKYYTSSITLANNTYSGVIYTTKSVTIGNNAIINGSIFAEGGITFNDKADNVQINPTNNYPALASQSNISSSDTGAPAQRIGLQNSAINGLVFADNNITFDYIKNSTFNGTILANSNISMQNGTGITINYNAAIFSPMTPGFTFSGEAEVDAQKDWNEIGPAL